MTRKAWFAWEHTSRGYAPVIYYDSLPNSKGLDKHLKSRIAQSYELGPEWFARDSEEIDASFAELEAAFPRPIDPVDPKFSLPLQDAAE